MLRRLLPLFLLAIPAMAATPPAVGDKAADFQLMTSQNQPMKLSELTAKGPVALIVLRGYPGYQCPFCNRQVQEFVQSAKAFSDAGAQVVFVYPGPADKATEFLSNKDFPASFTMLLDPEYKFANQYGLRWDAPKETAYPSTFLLDKQGTVFYSQVAKMHGGRTSAATILSYMKSAK